MTIYMRTTTSLKIMLTVISFASLIVQLSIT